MARNKRLNLTGEQLARLSWRRAPGSGLRGVEITHYRGYVLIRQPGRKYRKALVFDRNEWRAFLLGVHNNEFDSDSLFDDEEE